MFISLCWTTISILSMQFAFKFLVLGSMRSSPAQKCSYCVHFLSLMITTSKSKATRERKNAVLYCAVRLFDAKWAQYDFLLSLKISFNLICGYTRIYIIIIFSLMTITFSAGGSVCRNPINQIKTSDIYSMRAPPNYFQTKHKTTLDSQ